MDARLPAGDPGLHGMRRDRAAAASRSPTRLRNHPHSIRGVLGGGGRPAHSAMTRSRVGRLRARRLSLRTINEMTTEAMTTEDTDYLHATPFIDGDNPAVVEFAKNALGDAKTVKEKA